MWVVEDSSMKLEQERHENPKESLIVWKVKGMSEYFSMLSIMEVSIKEWSSFSEIYNKLIMHFGSGLYDIVATSEFAPKFILFWDINSFAAFNDDNIFSVFILEFKWTHLNKSFIILSISHLFFLFILFVIILQQIYVLIYDIL
ncbi:unnamed protein product [Blepharisma stoltei]|uniref:Uncharacterized protein n=1 Tax=Blepharisma stoltei TaxID=1481888 RepID=A0AAU9JCV3_9CILI|nr:unnamed protein product [Blepharisma stoltei]